MKRAALLLLALAVALPAAARPSLRVLLDGTHVVGLYWTQEAGAAAYHVERTTAFPAWSVQTSTTQLGWAQSGLAANTTYIYRIVPRDSAGNAMPASNAAIVSTHAHASNPLQAQQPIALQQMTDLRAVVRSIREAAGMGTPVWTRPTLTTSSQVADEDVLDLRNSLNAALQNVDAPLPAYVDPVLAGQPIRRIHFQQLRDLARAYPDYVTAASVTVSRPYFSPNADGAKDTVTFQAAVLLHSPPRVDFRWRLDVRHPSNGVVRSEYGVGTAINYVWDGRGNGGTVLPDAVYTFELIDLDSLSLPVAAGTTRLDVTPPTATVTSPAANFVISNVRSNGSGNVTVSGTASDDVALENWSLEYVTGGSTRGVHSSTTAVTSATLTTWNTSPPDGPPNSSGDLRLTVVDKAGNQTVRNTAVTIGHFSVTRSKSQMNIGSGETMTYTSIVPFPLTHRIEIYRSSTLVRTLVDAPRAAGTYTDTWDGKDTAGALVADGLHHYIATATEGASSMSWNRSSVFPPLGSSQYEYPKCWNGSTWIGCGEQTTFPFDPYGGIPLRIAYCVGQGNPDTGCSGDKPALVIAKMTPTPETSAACDAGCIEYEYLPSGRHEFAWHGLNIFGGYVADMPRMTVVRKYDGIAENATVVYGTAPVIHSVALDPPMFSPGAVPLPVGGQVITVNVTRFANRPVTLTAVIRHFGSATPLRTITTTAQTSNAVTLTWDGRAENGLPAAAGNYEIRLTVTDSHGSSAVVRLIGIVRY